MTLTEFLLARIAEDKAVARGAIGTAVFARQSGVWSFETVNDQYGPIPIVFAVADTGAKTQVANMEAAWEREERGAHIAHWDPVRVLAECEAKRELIKISDFYETDTGTEIMRALALPYSDHPDYNEEWKP